MKRIFAFFMLAASTHLLNAQGTPQEAQFKQAEGNRSNNSKQYSNQGYSGAQQDINDQMLTSQIQSLLSSSQYQKKFGNVTITVNNGNISLKGTVNSPEDKNSLGALIGGLNGVRSVYNQVTVKENH